MKNIFIITIASMTALFAVSALADTALITGNVVNNSKYLWGYGFYLSYPDGSGHDIHTTIPPFVTPAKGRFLIPAVVGKGFNIGVMSTEDGQLICTFFAKAISTNKAIMRLTSRKSNARALCDYSGNPTNNTATITLINNPRGDNK